MVSKPDANGSLGRLLYTTIISVILLIAIEDKQEKLGRNVCCIEDVVKKLAFPHPAENCKCFVNFRNFQGDMGGTGGGQVILYRFPLSMTQ